MTYSSVIKINDSKITEECSKIMPHAIQTSETDNAGTNA